MNAAAPNVRSTGGNAAKCFFVVTLGALVHCNGERKVECDRFLVAMEPLERNAPGADVVDGARRALDAIPFQDQPLREFATSTKGTLTVLTNTLRVQNGDSPPDGTDDLVKEKRREARAERSDVARYCSE